jgi:hypothetical protein
MEHEESTSKLAPTAVVFEGGLAVIAWLLGWLLHLKRPPLEQIVWDPAAIAWGAAATLPLLLALWLCTRFPLGPLKALKRVVQQSIVPIFGGCTLVDFALISLVAGIGEEMLFRGVVQEGLSQLSASPWLALGLASLLFGLVHPITTTYAVLAALIGLYLGALWLATGNLLVPIVTHALYDFGALLYLVRGQR